MRDYFDFKQKCEQKEKQIEILQLSTCTVNAPLKDKYDAIRGLYDTYSITLLCKTLKVARGSYYNHILRNKNENTINAQKKKELTPVIEEIFHNNNQIFGSSKIHAILKDRGYIVGQNTVTEMPFANVMLHYRSLGLPNLESVGRIRRKLQAIYPELAASPEVKKRRIAQERLYRHYSKE